jgi:SAM-dependent methyltransferase
VVRVAQLRKLGVRLTSRRALPKSKLKQVVKASKPHVPTFLLPAAAFTYKRVVLPGLAVLHERRDRRVGPFDPPLPPAALRVRVHTLPDWESFLDVGERCVGDLRSALAKVDRTLESFDHVLDFGCGCGRTLRWLDGLAEGAELTGTDIDRQCIEWCRPNLRFARFTRNNPLPPLEFADETFDLVYALSVYTHLNEAHQDAWLAEMHRVSRPGAVLLLSVHGPHVWPSLAPKRRSRVERDGFLWIESTQNAYHSPDYFQARCERYFNVLDYIPRGVINYQDLIVLGRPAAA